VKQGNNTESKLRNFGRKVNYQNITATDIINATKEHPMLITAVDKHHHELAAELIKAGVSIVIHDPTELKTPIAELAMNAKVIVIRESMLSHLPHATFIKHPYARHSNMNHHATKPAASISRIDFDKHTDIIIKANQQLNQPIDIYGFCNTVYAHFKLKPIDPTWEINYRGRFDADDLWAAKRIAETYERIVDMSIIKRDGGGTQYTFLEAADAGSALILNTGWQPRGLLARYAHRANDPDELATLCRNPIDHRTTEAQQLLKEHDAQTIAQEYLSLLL